MASGNRGRSPRKPKRWSYTIPPVFLIVLCLLVPVLFCALPARAESYADSDGHKVDPAVDGTYSLDPVIGIDLGTTYSCTAVYRNGRVEIIPNEQGGRITPSYVAFTQDGERLVGAAAKNQASSNPMNTIFDIKRIIGQSYNDESVKTDLRNFPFKVVNKHSKPQVQLENSEHSLFAPEQISAQLLSYLKSNAEAYLGEKVKNAVITVPAYFNDAQRAATRDAGELAGLNVLRLINEPTSAAIAYGIDLDMDEDAKNLVVYDLGGGTFDVSLLEIDSGVYEVLATGGDTHLGGEDFDNRVIDHFASMWNKKHPGNDVKEDLKAMSKLKREVERAKRTLSSGVSVARIEIEAFHDGKDLSEQLTRAKFEELNHDLFQRTLKKVESVLKDAGVSKKDVHEVVLIGGSTRIPKIQDMLSTYFSGKKLSKSINPDEAVAYGAAVHGAILSGVHDRFDGVLLLDVNSLTLGIETSGGVMASLIERNMKIPTKKTQIFSTTKDNQQSVEIRVFEGERPMVASNNLLGSFMLSGIPPAPRGVPQIEVTFEIDANGMLQVKASDKVSGMSQSTTITNHNRLSKGEIEKMIEEAQIYADKDLEMKELVDAKNRYETQIFTLKAELQDEDGWGKKLSSADKKNILTEVQEAQEWLSKYSSSVTKEDIEEKDEQLKEAVSSITSKLYTSGAEDNPTRQLVRHEDL